MYHSGSDSEDDNEVDLGDGISLTVSNSVSVTVSFLSGHDAHSRN